jgi:hypothetical protein
MQQFEYLNISNKRNTIILNTHNNRPMIQSFRVSTHEAIFHVSPTTNSMLMLVSQVIPTLAGVSRATYILFQVAQFL